MIIEDGIEFIDIDNKKELLGYYPKIALLFEESFNRPLDKELWDWAYLDNPFGQPLVSIAMVEGKVVGHYALVPMNLENDSSELSGYLSMTTMVAVDYRRHKLFQKLAERVYMKIEKSLLPTIVFGFPNDNSAPGFVKRLGWKISEDYKVVSLKPEQFESVASFLDKHLTEDFYTLNIDSDVVKNWRISKPNQEWGYKNGFGLKEIENGYDLMHVNCAESFKKSKVNTPVNMLLEINSELEQEDIEISFPYRFGYRLFNINKEPKLFVQMSMSDIF
ncbi:hypothetical protein P20311_2808 [Pseudoalteromonas sp. BSi20311]|uniref:GNAT family N-acetyltransferase n=1 Tax=Pseudoalteromonas sp. BSi20311 TaxID=383911 RepID=UPI000231A71A|nr:GNAT family N-acetyltransferase [Pseudoalteromonas sp. BSi20311]GAA65004.1 hypothetical protein P20311_2808 [Pseudoalteromonas sp. BSi20311]